MAFSKSIFTLLALMVVIASVACQASQGGPHQSQGGSHEAQGGPHESQGRSRRQAPQAASEDPNQIIAACANTTTVTSLSCYDCTTRLICKPNSIVLVRCQGNVKPFCNNGICSSVLSPECA